MLECHHSKFDLEWQIWDFGSMDTRIRDWKDLSSAEREIISDQIRRLRTDYRLAGELLTMSELARVLGHTIASLRNRRTRGQMPPIPVRRVGGQDFYWVGHVAMWLAFEPMEPPVAMEHITTMTTRLGHETTKKQEPSKPDEAKKSEKPKTKRGEESAAKAALMARANAIFEERMREQRKNSPA